ncbi:uncharacterized protein LOC135841610 [Planococcus citri]|uniref:uncharacterized protein LOC135841610 n=1 Tax=Planococcus citri TaxID=170843 RepID=UPI0031F90098
MAVKLYILGAALIAISCISVVSSTECDLFTWGKKDTIEGAARTLLNQCPAIVTFGQGKEYCCYDIHRDSYCCDTTEKVINVTIIVIIAIIIITIALSILSCIGYFLRSFFR